MKTIYFIRHGESVSNAGRRWDGAYQETPLTERGIAQAHQVADFFKESPQLIIHTTYTRTRETADPLIRKFPAVPIEVLPLHEFTYLNTNVYSGTTVHERRAKAVGYWDNNNPHHNDGGGAESFMDCVGRVTQAFPNIISGPEKNIIIFTHGQITQLTKLLLSPESKNKKPEEIMKKYREIELVHPIRNCEILKVTVNDNGKWGEMESVFIPEIED